MFDFFKKNKTNQPETVKKEVSAAFEPYKSDKGIMKPIMEKTVKADNIAIHVMPRLFRNQPIKQNSAKTTGLLIIIGGAAVLLIASAVLYYFLFIKSNAVIIEKMPLLTENNQPDQAGEIDQNALNQDNLTATETEMETLPSSDQIATTTIATTTPEAVPEGTELSLRFGADSDNDGLTDIEEILLSSGAIELDTDGDGYTDGAELVNLYDPAGTGKLTANSNISLYENKTFAYSLLYPSTWQTSINGGDDSLMFKSGDNQFIQVIIQPNVNEQELDAWYMEQLGILTINEADRVSGVNWQGLKSSDSLNIYLMDKKQNYIFSLTYSPGSGSVLEYFNIFKMMVKSFNLKD